MRLHVTQTLLVENPILFSGAFLLNLRTLYNALTQHGLTIMLAKAHP